MPAGRPSKYQHVYCKELVSSAAEGKSLTDFAADIGVARSTLNEWAGQHPEFSEAVNRAKAKIAAWWGEQARDVAKNGGQGGRATLVIFGLKNHAPEDYQDKQQHEHSGSIGSLSDAELNAQMRAKLIAAGVSEAQARAIIDG